jgi:hypothetical protein
VEVDEERGCFGSGGASVFAGCPDGGTMTKLFGSGHRRSLMIRIMLAGIAALLSGPRLGSAQQSGHLYDFATLQTFRCDFTESEGRRTTAAGVTSPAKGETFNDLVVDSVNYRQRTARFIGNAGSETVQVIDGNVTVSFLEVTVLFEENNEQKRRWPF